MKGKYKFIINSFSTFCLLTAICGCDNNNSTIDKNDENTYTITYHLEGATNDNDNPNYYKAGTETIILKAPTFKRLTFKGWYTDKNFEHPIATIDSSLKGNIDLYAKFEGPLIFRYVNIKDSITLYGRDIKLDYTENYKTEFINNAEKLIDDIGEETKAYNVLYNSYKELYDSYDYIFDQYNIAGIIADTTTLESDYDTYYELDNLTNLYYEYEDKVNLAFANSKYKNQFYEGWDEDELNEYISKINPNDTKEKNDIKANMNDILSDYMSGNSDAYEAYKEYVKYANKLAKAYGYDDYLDYAYEVENDRDYKTTDVLKIKDFIINKTSVLADKALDSYYSFKNTATKEEKSQLNNLRNNLFTNYLDYLDNYANMIGGEYLNNYNDLFEKGNYFLIATDNDNLTGYTYWFSDDTPYICLGKGYQDTKTFIHEFGHANAHATGGDNVSLDLCETQSQGNEMLFYQYLLSTDLYDSKVIQAYIDLQVYDFADATVTAYIINAIEDYAYTNGLEGVNKTAFFSEVKNICKEFDSTLYLSQDYVLEILLNYIGYYISYGTSAIASLELYAKSIENYNDALDSYKKIYAYNSDKNFLEVLEYAGLENIFDEKCYELIDKIPY